MSPVSNTPSAGTQSGISRRTLVKGAAWSVPVLMMAAPTPAFAAASGVCDPTFALNGSSYKCPGQGQNIKQYYLDICVSNLSGCSDPSDHTPTAAYIWGVKNQSGKQLVPGGGALWPIKIELTSGAGCSGLIEFVWPAGESGSSANWLYFLYNFTETNSNGATWSDQVVAPPNGTDQQCNPPAALASVTSANLVTTDAATGGSTDGATGSADGSATDSTTDTTDGSTGASTDSTTGTTTGTTDGTTDGSATGGAADSGTTGIVDSGTGAADSGTTGTVDSGTGTVDSGTGTVDSSTSGSGTSGGGAS